MIGGRSALFFKKGGKSSKKYFTKSLFWCILMVYEI